MPKSPTIPRWTEYVGWYGVLAILAAYTLLNLGQLATQSATYQLLNLTGSLALIINCFIKKDTEPLFLNIVWCIVAAISLLRLL